ncbi:MAG: hypothetical protein ABSA13_01385 [Beijerinckiaceae bacterium]|jgi:hypothetical protein
MRGIGIVLAALALALTAAPLAGRAETVSYVSIGCDTLEATQMAEEAVLDKMSGKDRNAFSRIDAYRKKAGPGACRPLNQGDQVTVVRQETIQEVVRGKEGVQDVIYSCVREREESKLRPDDPDCYWIRYRHLKLPPGVDH